MSSREFARAWVSVRNRCAKRDAMRPRQYRVSKHNAPHYRKASEVGLMTNKAGNDNERN